MQSSILRRVYNNSNSNSNRGGTKKTNPHHNNNDEQQQQQLFQLDVYSGHVLCTACLSSNTRILLLCHGESEVEWMNRVHQGIVAAREMESLYNVQKMDHCANPASSSLMEWYNLWILLHSMVLRVLCAPIGGFRMSELLGMSSPADSATTDIAAVYPFAPPDETILHHLQSLLQLVVMRSTHSRRHRNNILYVPKFTTYDFGPLGPFRGRDRPRSILVCVQDLMDVLLNDDAQSSTTTTGHNNDLCGTCTLDVECANTVAHYNQALLVQLDHVKSKVGWAFAVPAGTMRARPMNVASPRVSFMRIMSSASGGD